MRQCPSCGGLIGRDCFNPMDCAMISNGEFQMPRIGSIRKQFEMLLEDVSKRIQEIDPKAKFDLTIETTCENVHCIAKPFSNRPLLSKLESNNGYLFLSDIEEMHF